MANTITKSEVYVICSYCGRKHKLQKGIETPIYQCPKFYPSYNPPYIRLKEGDTIEYD